MPLDPQIQPLLEASAAFMTADWSAVDVEAVRAAARASAPPVVPLELPGFEDHEIVVLGGSIPARLYRPALDPDLPTVLFLHGGGWVMGELEDYDAFARRLAQRSGCAVLSVGYRLAPEHAYPIPLDDSYAALEWLAANAARLRLDPERLAVAGDSAGANLAAAVAYLARERNGPALRHQMLIYPATDRSCATVSYRENDRYLLTPDMMRWYWRSYVGERAPAETPYAAPAEFASLEGLPSATVLTAEYDPLRDEGEAYAEALARAGVPTEASRAPGMIHGFIVMTGVVDAAESWLDYVAGRLAGALRA